MGLEADSDTQLYGYIPTEWVCIIFVVLFSLSTAAHVGQSTYYKLPWLTFTIIPGGLLEILGWSGRLWNSISPRLLDGYLMQICCLIIGPAFLMAANYLILGLIINKLGTHFALLPSLWYTIIFCSGDITSLVIQAIGGGMAATSVQSKKIPKPDPNKGAKIMVVGIIFQMVIMLAYTFIAVDFTLRWALDKPYKRRTRALAQASPSSAAEYLGEDTSDAIAMNPTSIPEMAHSGEEIRRWKLLLTGLGISTLCIFIRSIYRTIELLDGWSGPIIANQALFSWLDGAMICVALIGINIFHPGRLLRTRNNVVSLGMARRRKGAAKA